MLRAPAHADDWPQWRGADREGLWREQGIVESFPAEGLPVCWRAPLGSGFSGPAVAKGKVFVMDRVLAAGAPKDVKTQWNYRDKTTMSTVLLSGKHLYGVSVYGETCCLDAADGSRVWTTLEPTSGGSEPHDRWCSAFFVPHGDKVFIFNEKGDLILARLQPSGYEELARTHVLDPDMASSGGGGRKVIWSHPAFANRCVVVRNDHEIIRVSLAAIN